MKKRQMTCEQALNMMGPSGYRDPLKSSGTTAGMRPQGGPVQSRPERLTPVWLKRDGDRVTVSVEVDGQWIEVIREFWDSPFSHIWEGRLPTGNPTP